MNKPKDRLTKFYESYLRENRQLFNEDVFAQNMYKALMAGDNEVYQKNVNENKIFDEKWIETLESYFPSIDKIMRNPKSGLMYEEDVVLIEKARKTTAQSVKHLSANTHLIRDIVDGDVRPKKIQVTFSEIEYATYDNRMVATLVERLFYFVRSRYEVIKGPSSHPPKSIFRQSMRMQGCGANTRAAGGWRWTAGTGQSPLPSALLSARSSPPRAAAVHPTRVSTAPWGHANARGAQPADGGTARPRICCHHPGGPTPGRQTRPA